jgi:hypothetical protein
VKRADDWLASPAVITVTVPVTALSGTSAVIVVGPITLNTSEADPPKLTFDAAEKPVPVRTTLVNTGPDAGWTDETDGAPLLAVLTCAAEEEPALFPAPLPPHDAS